MYILYNWLDLHNVAFTQNNTIIQKWFDINERIYEMILNESQMTIEKN